MKCLTAFHSCGSRQMLMQAWHVDFLTKKRIKNNGNVPQYYVENDHEAIIPRELFLLVQEELVRRRNLSKRPDGKKRNFSSNHCFAQIVICGECGEFFRRIHWNNHGCKSIVWRCMSRLETGNAQCHARTVNEPLLQEVSMKAINQMLGNKEEFLKTLQQNIASVVRASEAASIEDIDKRLEELQKELLRLANSKSDYDAIADEIYRLRELKQQSEAEGVHRNEQINRIAELHDFIKTQPSEITTFDETLVRRMIEKISVFESFFTITFKSGVSIDVEA